jgi:import receptor subunit TOM22-like
MVTIEERPENAGIDSDGEEEHIVSDSANALGPEVAAHAAPSSAKPASQEVSQSKGIISEEAVGEAVDAVWSWIGTVGKYVGKAAWVGAVTFAVALFPLALEVERDVQLTQLEQQMAMSGKAAGGPGMALPPGAMPPAGFGGKI